MAKVIGKVSATEKYPSTIDEFYFWTDKKQILSPFDVVKVNHESGSITFGVVEEINHITDAPSHFTSYISSDFGDTNDGIGNMNRLGTTLRHEFLATPRTFTLLYSTDSKFLYVNRKKFARR